MKSEELEFAMSEEKHLLLLRSLEDMEFAAQNAKGHAYERRWTRARVNLLAVSHLIRNCLEYVNALDHYDKTRPPSQT